MILYRNAIFDDIYRPDVRKMVLAGLSAEKIGLDASEEKLESLAERALTRGAWFVAENNGKVVAHIVGLVEENPFFEGKQLIVIAWYSLIPGCGMKLLNMLMDWKRQDPEILSTAISTNPDEKLKRILERKGWLMMPQYLNLGD